MKKYMSLFVAAIIIMCGLAGCGTEKTQTRKKTDSLRIVTTIFPEYDWVREILGDNSDGAEVTLLLDNGVDLHSFQPTADDILKISTCDLFIYVGGESDAWVEDALKEAVNKDMKVINLLDVLGENVKEEELVEGMEEDAGIDEKSDGDSAGKDENAETEKAEPEREKEPEYDEHVWLSLKNASVLCDQITDALCRLDEKNADNYKENLNAYKKRLASLDEAYQDAADNARIKTLLFGDRFPFRYLVDDYRLDYYAAFAGCSAETEASFETIIFLADKTDELGVPAILTIEGSSQKIAETIRENTKSKNQKILSMDSMQSVKSEDVEKGITYVDTMEKNLEVLKETLK